MNAIYISTFGFPTMKIRGGVPIEVGCNGRNNFVYDLKDNTKDNIADLNEYYGELTGLYWVWKNGEVSDNDIVGFCHYNKSLMCDISKAEKLIAAGKCEWIVGRRQIVVGDFAYNDEFMKMHNTMKKILREHFPAWYDAYNDTYGEYGESEKCNAKNMFITNGANLNEYCTELFCVLDECYKIIGEPNMRSKRYNAGFAERLLTPWLIYKQKSVKESDYKYNRRWLTIAKMMVNRLPFGSDSKILQFFRKHMRFSSYKMFGKY